ncbi:aspartate--tRNA ligase [Mycoplasma miroungirhinis]|uniref:Aspartate--tRNA ligase n=1 Tax=Mycoplasma miroungirhinis TaxID=754516 RepID=A0A6M4JDK3_9MOLU|nr:aspartate--tRNA ligase [Mycoplasma miroungirhinis]QJR44146.1 aspartate--tRNA ligase [Mycoplasma miroungirhinis]
MKTLFNNEINSQMVDSVVTLYGWIATKRKFKSQLFVDLRDRSGIIQIIFQNVSDPKLTKESVIKITGKVQKRLEANVDIENGDIEILVSEYEILNSSEQIPFEITKDESANEDLRLQYRFLDLRSQKMQYNIALRHKVALETRKFFDQEGFLEIETPILSKSTPEGARDYLVPTRKKGKFFALPQSPQLYKQLLMASGFERYFQIARVFRDEDLRKDRQPEFTQIDFEMSFVDKEDLFKLVENYYKHIFNSIGLNLEIPFKRMDYFYSLDKYGNDKPDTRFKYLLEDISDKFNDANTYKAIYFDKKESLNVNKVFELAKKNQAKNFIIVEIENKNFKNIFNLNNTLDETKLKDIFQKNIFDNGYLFISFGKYNDVIKSLGAIRTYLNEEFKLANNNEFHFVWIVNWPMFELKEDTNEYEPAHHAFTMIDPSTYHYLENHEYDKVKAQSYDLVLNGFELGSGSVRIYDYNLQKLMFEHLKLSAKEIESKFGFFLKSFKYGLPPHCGMAFGMERILMILTQSESIRDVIAFPKNAKGLDLLSNSPSEVTDFQLSEYSLKLNK